MLTQEDNELLTRVGAGTPMGEYFRRYWLPVMLASELPSPDCPPVRVRLLGEDLVALRDTDGRLGLLSAYCAHRGAPLFFGRNEECGLRCVYHGWKYDISGACVDMPNEPPESRFKEKIQLRSYPLREAGKILWAYLGPAEHMPEMPQFEFLLGPEDHMYVHKRIQDCNWLQSLEGELDSSHVSFLHERFDDAFGLTSSPVFKDKAPRFTVRETDYGLLIGARRNSPIDDTYYWRISQFLLPSYVMIPTAPERFGEFAAAVPVDDESIVGFQIGWRPDRAMSEADIRLIESWEWAYAQVDPVTFRMVRNRENDYQIDRTLQRTTSFTGIKGLRDQDVAVQEGMGPLQPRRRFTLDRSYEHLGSSDLAIIRTRALLKRQTELLQEGKDPYPATHGEAYRVRAAGALLKKDVDFAQGAKDLLIARPGEDPMTIARERDPELARR